MSGVDRLKGWAKKATPTTEGERLPNLYDTLRIMKHDRGVDQALLYLMSLRRDQLLMIKTPSLLSQLSRVACLNTESSSTTETPKNNSPKALKRALGAIKLLSQLQAPPPCLAERWLRPGLSSSRQVTGDLAFDLLSRASALAYRRGGRVDLLQGMTKHPDPEVREHAAHAGADPETLCTCLNDPWRLVRFAAIRGLEKVSDPRGLCLIETMSTLDDDLRIRSVIALGRLAESSWAKGQSTPPHLSQALRELSRAPQESISIRRAALVALARWGSFSEAEAMVIAHLKSGGLVEVTRGALHAIISSGSQLSKTLTHKIIAESESTVLRLDALKWLSDPRAPWESLDPPYTTSQRLAFVRELLKGGVHHQLYEATILRVLESLESLVYNPSAREGYSLPSFDLEDEP